MRAEAVMSGGKILAQGSLWLVATRTKKTRRRRSRGDGAAKKTVVGKGNRFRFAMRYPNERCGRSEG
jgi:hypothetical protein